MAPHNPHPPLAEAPAGEAPSAAWRAGLLARADAAEVTGLAERALDDLPLVVVRPPEVGTLLLPVREPVAEQRFNLGELVASRATVAVDDVRGWGMRLGDDRLAALAAAVCDVVVATGHALADDVIALCHRTQQQLDAERSDDVRALAPTVVAFDELDA